MRKYPQDICTENLKLSAAVRARRSFATDPLLLCGYVRGLVPRGLFCFGVHSAADAICIVSPLSGPAVTLRRQCRQALPSIRRACLHLALRLATAFCPQAKTLPLSSSLNSKPRAEATMLPRNDLTFATNKNTCERANRG
jgi:hypothetical protein